MYPYMDHFNQQDDSDNSADLRSRLSGRMDLNAAPAEGGQVEAPPGQAVNTINPAPVPPMVYPAFPFPTQAPYPYAQPSPGIPDPAQQWWQQNSPRFYTQQYPFNPVPPAFHPAYVPSPIAQEPQPVTETSSHFRPTQQPRRSVHSRLGPEEGSGLRQSPRRSAFDRIQPTARQRLGVRTEDRMSVDPSQHSQKGDSEEVSSSRPRQRREARRHSNVDLPSNILEQVRQEFNKWKHEQTARPSEPVVPLLAAPFTTDIMQHPFPIDLKVPGSGAYDGKTDPDEHVNSYYGNMLMMGVPDAVICRAFFSTLTGRAAEWFKGLTPGSISSFPELARLFIRRFSTSRSQRKHWTHLNGRGQAEGETLSAFVTRWKNEMAEIEPMDERTAVNLFHQNLRSGILYEEFVARPPKTFDEALQRATDRAAAIEANAAKRRSEVGPPGRDRRPDQRNPDRSNRPKDKAPVSTFTPLTRPVAEIFQYARSCNLVQMPRPSRDGQDKTKYCAYHRNRGHDTEECHSLREVIEGLLKSGELAHFAKREGNKEKGSWKRMFKRSDKPKDKDKAPSPDSPHPGSKPVIHVIFGGPEGSDSNERRNQGVGSLQVGLVDAPPAEKKRKTEPIMFSDEDLPRTTDLRAEALVIAMDINGFDVERVMVDTGSSVNVLYLDVFNRMKLERSQLSPVNTPLSGFTGDLVQPEGMICLPVEIGHYPKVLKTELEFIVVNLKCVHNVILGRPGIAQMGAVISMPHLCMKFLTPEGVGVARGNVQSARKCYARAVQKQDTSTSRVNTISKRKDDAKKEQPEPADATEEVPLFEDRPQQVVKIGTMLPPEVRTAVLQILREYYDIFAWGPGDMPGIDRNVICHHLTVNPTARPIKQKQRHLSTDRREFVRKEVRTLAAIGHVREVLYPDWVANVVLVPKAESFRMCIDYTDLNRACPLDPYPLPSIHQMVDETAGAELMSFMDAFKGYHQIMMAEEDESKTSFVTPDGLYCYRVMPFGLRNAGATYQRMINLLFGELLGKTMEAYVDDMLVKSTVRADHVSDLRSCFQIMRRHNMRLNPAKCTFAVQSGKFLGFMMTRRGIEPNPAKVRAILDMQPPSSVREVQQLTGRLAALSRFLSRLAEKSIPFFKTLRKASTFRWSEECQVAFEGLKEYLASPIVLSKPEPGEDLDLYLAATDHAVGAVLCRTDANNIQRPVYYVSHALQGPEVRYSRLEKIVFALVIAAKKLTPYFQGRTIHVLTDQPIGSVLRTADSSGRLIKWAMMLTQFAIEYRPRPAIKGQALADFVTECTARDPETAMPSDEGEPWWNVATDGSANSRGSGGGVVVTTPEGFKIYEALLYKFRPTNNEAEYEALLAGLRLARHLGASKIRARTDSNLVVGQVTGNFEAREDRLIRYRDRALSLLAEFQAFDLQHIPRSENADADILSRMIQEAPEQISKVARITELESASIDIPVVAPITTDDTWIADLVTFLKTGQVPSDKSRSRKVRLRAPRFEIIDDRLYRRSYGGPLMRCLNAFEADLVMTELHSGLCSSHQGGRSLARRILVIGYYWPSIQLDCEKLAKECKECQAFARMSGRPSTYYQPVSTAIPFARWGVDILGPFPELPGRRRFIIVAIDYFSKWIEAEPLATITSQQCERFLWRNVVSRFGVPVQIITDNGRQFESKSFQNFLATIGTRAVRVSVAYPQGNGQVENANRTILEGLKKKLHSSGRNWAEELPYILWSYRTTPREATRETPFALVYGAEARLPIEAWVATAREMNFVAQNNEQMLALDLDCLEEKRDVAARRMVDYQQRVKVYHDARVRPRYFQVGDYVLRRREASRPLEGGKLSLNWEGPYVISAVVRPGTYKLETTKGKVVDRLWNSDNLVRFRH